MNGPGAVLPAAKIKTVMIETLTNFVDGAFVKSGAAHTLPVKNPATAQVIGEVPLSPAAEVDRAVQAAVAAFKDWRRTPVGERIQPLFRLKTLMEQNRDDLARTITNECGKTYEESVAEVQRAIENIEVASGAPTLMQGINNEDISRGIDEHMIRQPLGVAAAITPFNFPLMVPMWFLPYAVACGNAFLLKPSEKVPMTVNKLMALVEQAKFPKGVIQVVNGDKEVVDAILDHPSIRAISFVGSTNVAKYIYSRGTANGKRVQAQGGAKNPDRHHARRGYGDDHAHRGRLGIWLRRPALSGRQRRHHRGESAQRVFGVVGRCRRPAARWATAWTARRRWGR